MMSEVGLTQRDIRLIAAGIAKALEMEPRESEEYISKFVGKLLQMGYDVYRLMLITLNEYWYTCLLSLYELTTKLRRHGFLVEADVPPESTYTYEIDLTKTDKACVCPVFYAASDLGPYVKLTNLVNESPVDMEAEWTDKYAAINMPLPSDIPSSLRYGWNYVKFPKRKVKVIFANTHPTETAHCVFYADYLEMNYRYAIHLIKHVYQPMVRELEELMLP